jgi:hypothetical protein
MFGSVEFFLFLAVCAGKWQQNCVPKSFTFTEFNSIVTIQCSFQNIWKRTLQLSNHVIGLVPGNGTCAKQTTWKVKHLDEGFQCLKIVCLYGNQRNVQDSVLIFLHPARNVWYQLLWFFCLVILKFLQHFGRHRCHESEWFYQPCIVPLIHWQ